MIDAFESMNHTLVMSCNVQRLEKNAINIWFNNHFRYTLVTESTFKTTDKKKNVTLLDSRRIFMKKIIVKN